MQNRLRTEVCLPSKEIVVEEENIKCYGENYQAVKIKNRVSLKRLVGAIFGFLSLSFVVLGVLVLCGV